jgi:DNA-binding transcriptional MerR regulator
MMTVNEVSKATGVSIRTLHYYDQIGLLKPTAVTEAGYRLYDDIALERLQQILLFCELEFPRKEIIKILASEQFDRVKALEQQIELLTLKKEHIENLISFARGIKMTGERNMDFKAFDKSKIDEYTKQAKEEWGNTEAYKEFEMKNKKRTKEEGEIITEGLMDIFKEFGGMMDQKTESDLVQKEVEKLQEYISKNFYQCTKTILESLGKMYGAGGEFTQNIDGVGGKGCAEFAAKAIEIYCNE